MKRKKAAKTPSKKRQPPLRIPIPFERLVDGVLGISSQDAKRVRESTAKKKK